MCSCLRVDNFTQFNQQLMGTLSRPGSLPEPRGRTVPVAFTPTEEGGQLGHQREIDE